MRQRFSDRVAIVTGASRGIGLAVAQRLVEEGARVCLTGRDRAALELAAGSLGTSENVLAVAGKADDADHQTTAVAETIRTFGRLDILVNNAGINPAYGPLLDLDLGAAKKVVELNCLAPLAWTQRACHSWMSEHGGAIVNVASIAAKKASPGIGLYGASKAMLCHLTSQLAFELGPGIRVNAVAPAVVKTKFAAALYEGREAELAARYPLKRLGEPGDVASLVAFLLSDEAGWITGQTYVVDGGATLAGA